MTGLSGDQNISGRDISISGYQVNTGIPMKDVDQKAMLAFLSEANDYFSRIQPYVVYQNYHYFTPGDIFYIVSLSNLLNTTLKDLSDYERLSYFNELVVKLDQIKLGLLYGNLNEMEKNLVKRSLKFVVDTANTHNYNAVVKKER